MKLLDYLYNNRITIVQFSQLTGFCSQYISLVGRGVKRPSYRAAKILSDHTNGQVTIEELQALVSKKEKGDEFKELS